MRGNTVHSGGQKKVQTKVAIDTASNKCLQKSILAIAERPNPNSPRYLSRVLSCRDPFKKNRLTLRYNSDLIVATAIYIAPRPSDSIAMPYRKSRTMATVHESTLEVQNKASKKTASKISQRLSQHKHFYRSGGDRVHKRLDRCEGHLHCAKTERFNRYVI